MERDFRAMKTANPNTSGKRRIHAYTLIEMLVVIAIIGTLLVISVPALSSLLESNNLTRAGQLLADQIGLARQIAAAKNKAVEVRLIKSDPDSTNGYSGIQLWIADEAGGYKTANRLASLPKGILISEQPSISAAFGPVNGLSTTNSMPANTGAVSNLKYAAFQVRPSGTITPSLAMSNATLTIVSSKFATNNSLPKNYVTIQINPLTATPLVYRP
jgi:uncharacterized protein (TIGR02596 family)